MAAIENTQPRFISRLLVALVAAVVAVFWIVFLFGNPFASADAGVIVDQPIVVEVVDAPASENIGNEEIQRLQAEAGASHDAEALIHTEPTPDQGQEAG